LRRKQRSVVVAHFTVRKRDGRHAALAPEAKRQKHHWAFECLVAQGHENRQDFERRRDNSVPRQKPRLSLKRRRAALSFEFAPLRGNGRGIEIDPDGIAAVRCLDVSETRFSQ
jgi:hypothetical protein